MAIFDNNPLYKNISSLTNPITSGLGNLFEGMNVFGARPSEALTGILTPEQQNKLSNQALLQGLLGTAATYFSTPKNLGAGSVVPYLGKAYLGGMQQSQNVYDQALAGKVKQLELEQGTKKLEMEGLTPLEKLMKRKDILSKSNPNDPNIKILDKAIAKESGGAYGSSVEGVSYNIVLQGSGNSDEARAFRKTPEYAIAYRELFAPKTVVQTVQDPVTGITKQVPVQIQQAAPPKNILPPEYIGAEKLTSTSQTTADLANVTGGNVASSPTALTPQQATKYKEKIDQSMLLEQTINALKDDINNNGMQLFGLGERGAYQASLYEDALTQIRIAAELGVLNKEDLPRLMKALPNPTDLSSYIKGGGSSSAVMGAFKAIEDKNKRQIDFYTKKLNPQDEKPATKNVNTLSKETKQEVKAKTIVRTGKDKSGRVVIQYSDGSISYGN